MTDNTMKYQRKREGDPPHLGNFAKWFIAQQHTPKNELSKHLEISPNNLSRYFAQHSLQFNILWRISRYIKYNMIMDLGQRMDIPFETEVEKMLKAKVAEHEAHIKKLELQIAILRETRQ